MKLKNRNAVDNGMETIFLGNEIERQVFIMKQNEIMFTTEEGEQIPFYVIEQTTIAGKNYLLVTDSEEDEAQEAEAYIMREITDDDSQIVYELVEDDHELSAISKVFEELLDDIDIEM